MKVRPTRRLQDGLPTEMPPGLPDSHSVVDPAARLRCNVGADGKEPHHEESRLSSEPFSVSPAQGVTAADLHPGANSGSVGGTVSDQTRTVGCSATWCLRALASPRACASSRCPNTPRVHGASSSRPASRERVTAITRSPTQRPASTARSRCGGSPGCQGTTENSGLGGVSAFGIEAASRLAPEQACRAA